YQYAHASIGSGVRRLRRYGLGDAKLPAAALASKSNNDGKYENSHNLETRQSPGIPKAVAQSKLNGIGGSRQQDPNLVRKPGNQPPRFFRGELVQVSGDDAPGSLHSNLHQDRRSRQHVEGTGKGPEWNDQQRQAKRRQHGTAPSESLGVIAKADPTD